MKRIISFALILCALFVCNAQNNLGSFQKIDADNPNIQYIGRIDYSNMKAPKFGFTGAQIYANFTGTSISMVMKPNSGYYMVELDDKPAYKIRSLEDSVVCIAKGLENTNHRLCITQCNEAVLVKFPTFHGFIIDKGASLLEKTMLPARKIEFIGNSITCALGIEDTTEKHNGNSVDCQNAYYSYAAQTARKLNAQYIVVARSGIGVYRNNGGNINGDTKVMPYYYSRSMYSDSCQPWDFNCFTPDVVCINLGTNDTAQNYIVSKLTDGMTSFLLTVHSKYPAAKIVLLTGTMRKNQRLADLKKALDDAMGNLKNRGVSEVYRLDFTPADGSLGYGAGYHPSLLQHGKMSDELTPFLRRIMNW